MPSDHNTPSQTFSSFQNNQKTNNKNLLVFKETTFSSHAQGYVIEETLFEKDKDETSPAITIFKNKKFGTVMTLGRALYTTTFDAAHPHEMITHTPLLTHRDPKHILIVGDNLGGIVREVLKHSTLETITLVIPNDYILTLSSTYLYALSQNIFKEEKVNIIYQDPLQYVKNCSNKFDVIISNPHDINSNELVKYYQACAKLITANGIVVTQTVSPFLDSKEFNNHYQTLSKLYLDVAFFKADVPSIYGGQVYFSWSANNELRLQLSEAKLKKRLDQRIKDKLTYYTVKIHLAAFALSKKVEDELEVTKKSLHRSSKSHTTLSKPELKYTFHLNPPPGEKKPATALMQQKSKSALT